MVEMAFFFCSFVVLMV